MSSLCLFTIPKPFAGHIGTIQRNAIRSWKRLGSSCDIVLCGDDAGVEEIARDHGVAWLGNIRRNRHGTPLLNDAFAQVAGRATASHLAYVNADILLPKDFLDAVSSTLEYGPDFLLAGECRNLHVAAELESNEQLDQAFRRARNEGLSRGAKAIDYFVFPRGLADGFPEMAVGRGCWDNYFLFRARLAGLCLVDGTETVLAIHQDHDYAHHTGGKAGAHRGEEYEEHARMIGSLEHEFHLEHATHLLRNGKLEIACETRHWRRFHRAAAVLDPKRQRRHRLAWKTLRWLRLIAPPLERFLERRWRKWQRKNEIGKR
jgi:hypothetical protein